MRDLARRLVALESRVSNRGFRRVVIIGPDDPAPPNGEDIHIIRIVGVGPRGSAIWALPHNGRDPLESVGT